MPKLSLPQSDPQGIARVGFTEGSGCKLFTLYVLAPL
jgi:hypothetical protein